VADRTVHVSGPKVEVPMTEPVLASGHWPRNSQLIADVARLGYLDGHVLDPTYGSGGWWHDWQPEQLTHHNRGEDGVDFRHLPYADETFDAVAYDPPYVAMGGRKTSTLGEMTERYGMLDAPENPTEMQHLINDGLHEMVRVVKRKGYLLVKCQDYIWSGKFWPGTHLTAVEAFRDGMELVDRFEHVTKARPQPTRTRKCTGCDGNGRLTDEIGDPRFDNSEGCERCDGEGRVPSPQGHARRNLSTLFVFRKPARWKDTP